MSDVSYSLLLRNLSDDYYRRRIGFEDYRVRRKSILDKIDQEFNNAIQAEPENDDQDDTETITMMQTIAFIANTDIDK